VRKQEKEKRTCQEIRQQARGIHALPRSRKFIKSIAGEDLLPGDTPSDETRRLLFRLALRILSSCALANISFEERRSGAEWRQTTLHTKTRMTRRCSPLRPLLERSPSSGFDQAASFIERSCHGESQRK
jgi:hypothetical protein